MQISQVAEIAASSGTVPIINLIFLIIILRAQPECYEQGKVRHVGYLSELEEELAGFSTYGYTGEHSPNRADAAIWALAALFPAIVGATKKVEKVIPLPNQTKW